MLRNEVRGSSSEVEEEVEVSEDQIRDIHALTPPPAPPQRAPRNWDGGSSHRSSSLSVASSEENFGTMSREFNALVLAGSTIAANRGGDNGNSGNNNDGINNINNLERIGEEEMNPLAIVPDTLNLNPVASPRERSSTTSGSSTAVNNINGGLSVSGGGDQEITMQRVKREEVEAKISAWQNAKVAKMNNRFKREDAIINGWESEQVQKATSWMKKVERKLEEKRAKAMEKMQNDVAKAHRKAEERRASAEAKRGTKVARVLEISNLMRALGRPPVKRSFF